jgi:hypothetical protein
MRATREETAIAPREQIFIAHNLSEQRCESRAAIGSSVGSDPPRELRDRTRGDNVHSRGLGISISDFFYVSVPLALHDGDGTLFMDIANILAHVQSNWSFLVVDI